MELEDIRRLTINDVHLYMKLTKKEDKSSCIPKYPINLGNKLSEESLKQKEHEIRSELVRDLYNISSDPNLEELINNSIRLELLSWWRRNILNNSKKKDF
jgi:hypothetical protein